MPVTGYAHLRNDASRTNPKVFPGLSDKPWHLLRHTGTTKHLVRGNNNRSQSGQWWEEFTVTVATAAIDFSGEGTLPVGAYYEMKYEGAAFVYLPAKDQGNIARFISGRTTGGGWLANASANLFRPPDGAGPPAGSGWWVSICHNAGSVTTGYWLQDTPSQDPRGDYSFHSAYSGGGRDGNLDTQSSGGAYIVPASGSKIVVTEAP